MKKTIFKTALLLAGVFIMGIQETKAQVSRKSIIQLEDQQNSFIRRYGTNEVIVSTNQDGSLNQDVMVTVVNSAGVVSSNKYGSALLNERAVSCFIDNDFVVILYNIPNYENVGGTAYHRFGVMKIDLATNNLDYNHAFEDGVGRDYVATNIVKGLNENYFFTAIRLEGRDPNSGVANDFDRSFLVEFDASDPTNIIFDRIFNETNYGFYDLVQLTNDVWAICGAFEVTEGNRYDATILIYDVNDPDANLNNPIQSQGAFDYITGQHDNFDKIIADTDNNRLYLAAVGTYGGNDDFLAVRIDYDPSNNFALTHQWSQRYDFIGNQRCGSIEYDPVDDQVVLWARDFNSTDHGIIVCLASDGTHQWAKRPSVGVTPNSTDWLRGTISGNELLYTGVSNDNLFWGSETYGAGVSACFEVDPIEPVAEIPAEPNFGVTVFETQFNPHSEEISISGVEASQENPCLNCYLEALNDDEVKKIMTNTTISGKTVYGLNNVGTKYYISATITVPNGASLDLTGIDMVFGREGEIVVEAGGSLRANNTVFRPCEDHSIWQGITFQNGASEVKINNCVFKQAVTAISIEGAGGSNEAEITNNQFSNCLVSVSISETFAHNGSISNNVFFVDEYSVDFSGYTTQYAGANQYVGIFYADQVSENSRFNIAQNEFVYANGLNKTKWFYAIYTRNSNTTISKNTFTNCDRAVDVESPKNVFIENNEMELNVTNYIYNYQVRLSNVSGAYNMEVANNTITNYNKGYSYSNYYVDGGIYVDNSTGFKIFENEINGFVVGVFLATVTNGQVFSNRILNAKTYGIFCKHAYTTSLRCNDIDLNFGTNDYGNLCYGIWYEETDPFFIGATNNLEIWGNCIKNTHTAIGLYSQYSRTLPRIENNYLYSYTHYGVHNHNFRYRNIGEDLNATGGGNKRSEQAGRNTFISNGQHSFDGAIDVFSDVAIELWGNFNVEFISTNVTVRSNDDFYSTTACGNFFIDNLNYSSRLETGDKCDASPFLGSVLFQGPNVGVPDRAIQVSELVIVMEQVVKTKSTNERLTTWASASRVIAKSDDNIKVFLQNVDKYEPNEVVKHLTHAYAYCVNGKYDMAEAALSSVDVGDDAWLKITKERISLLIEVYKNNKSVNEAKMGQLNELTKESDFFANELRVVLNPIGSSLHFPFSPLSNIETTPVDQRGVIKHVGQNTIKVYPNPVNGNEISIDVSTPDIPSSTVIVRDITGRVVATQQVNVSMGTVKVSIADLTNGIYFVSVESDEEVIATEKLIVTH